MSSNHKGLAIVIMGVSGSGKSALHEPLHVATRMWHMFGTSELCISDPFCLDDPTQKSSHSSQQVFVVRQSDVWLRHPTDMPSRVYRTIGEMLAIAMGCSFLDADDFHPQANKDKMSKGIPLSEEDRIPWLETLRDTLREYMMSGKTVILGCSALQRKYREILRSADPAHEPGSYNTCMMKFVCLEAPAEVIAARLQRRAEEGKHFMPTSLLQSQLDLLQIDDGEGVIKADATLSPESIVARVQDKIF